MNDWILLTIILVGILVIIGMILILIFWKKEKKEINNKEINYKAFFFIGIIWIPFGIVFMTTVNSAIGIAFMTIGIVYMAIGLANRHKWDYEE